MNNTGPGERDPYELCRYVQHYHRKNGYALRVSELDVSEEFLAKLVANGVLEVLPLYEGGSPVAVCLTDKGRSMAERRGR